MSRARRADERLLLVFRRDLHAPPVARAAHALSVAGELGLLWHALAAVGAAVDRERRSAWARVALAVFATWLVNAAIKNAVRRRRPRLAGLPPLMKTVSDLSFPSAHTSMSFAAARAASGLVPAPPLYVTATAMAVSRLVLGVHYPSDIGAGIVLGTAVGSVGGARSTSRPSASATPCR